MKKAKIEFTEEEANVVLNLIDEAVKARGLAVANNAMLMAEKIRTAFQPKEGTG